MTALIRVPRKKGEGENIEPRTVSDYAPVYVVVNHIAGRIPTFILEYCNYLGKIFTKEYFGS